MGDKSGLIDVIESFDFFFLLLSFLYPELSVRMSHIESDRDEATTENRRISKLLVAFQPCTDINSYIRFHSATM